MVASSTPSSGRGGLSLAGEFPEPAREQWQRQVDKILRRSGLLGEDATAPDPVEDVLASTTYDDITVHPLYTAADHDAPHAGYPGLAPFDRGGRAQGHVTEGWEVRQQHAHPDPAVTNREILADLFNGANSVWLRLGPSGLDLARLPEALHDVYLDMISVVLDADADYDAAAHAFLDLTAQRETPPSALHGTLGADPLSVLARTGTSCDHAPAVALAHRCAENFPALRTFVASGLPYHDAGGADAEEIGCALASATTSLRWLTDSGMDIDTAARAIEFRLAASCDQFLTISKFRVARRLWEQITRACGASESARSAPQHAVTSSAMLTRRDPWVNMLRCTIAAFGAAMGGAHAITVQPFDAAIGLPDPFARRVARNTQALLVDESHLAQVIDPAGGSWYVEALTDELAGAAWEWFQRIEAAGGLPSALESGLVAERLATTWQHRRHAIAHRTDPITGVSEFPNLDEPTLTRDPLPPEPEGGLPRVRYAQDFEALRDAADTHLADTGERPRVFLATLGSIAAHNARASFARNLFAAGGVDAVDAGPTEGTEDVLAAFERTPSPVVCLCSTDALYAERAAEVAAALKNAGANRVLLAGKPKPPPSDVDDFLFAGCDALAVLHDIHGRLGVRS